MKKYLRLALMLVIGIALVGCSSNKNLVIPTGVLNFDLKKMSTEDQKKHDELVEFFKTIKDDTKLAYGTTSTANIFSQLGLDVSGAPESPSLDKDLTSKQVNIKEFKAKENVANLGSAIKLNMEAVVKLKPDYFLYSDAMAAMATNYKTLEDNGIKLVKIPQSNYQDMFILIDAMKQAGFNNDKLNSKLKEFNEDLKTIQTKIKDKKAKSVVLVQVAGGENLSLGQDSMLGSVVNSLGINNVFNDVTSSALNTEKIVAANPDVIFHYTHSMQMGDKTTGFEETIKDKKYQSLNAVKNNKVIAMGNDQYAFTPSVDLNITKMMLQVVEHAYE